MTKFERTTWGGPADHLRTSSAIFSMFSWLYQVVRAKVVRSGPAGGPLADQQADYVFKFSMLGADHLLVRSIARVSRGGVVPPYYVGGTTRTSGPTADQPVPIGGVM